MYYQKLLQLFGKFTQVSRLKIILKLYHIHSFQKTSLKTIWQVVILVTHSLKKNLLPLACKSSFLQNCWQLRNTYLPGTYNAAELYLTLASSSSIRLRQHNSRLYHMIASEFLNKKVLNTFQIKYYYKSLVSLASLSKQVLDFYCASNVNE